jgi:hypothetical protein
MERIIPPIRPQEHGTAVANFQEEMLFIVQKRQLSPGGPSSLSGASGWLRT